MKTTETPLKGIAGLKAHWKDDLKAGFSVSLIALPLCLGIALASGFPPVAGLIAAIIGGLLVSRIAGSFVTITGPAAGLIVVNLAAIESLGQGDNVAGYHYALAAILVAGVIIVALGFLKAGKLGDFFPTSAVHGMLAAIGVIIMVKQLFVAFAFSAHGHEFLEILAELPGALRHANPDVAIISGVSLLILIFYPKVKWKLIKLIPAPLWVILVAIPLEFALDFEHEHLVKFLGEDHKVGPQLLVHLPDNIAESIAFPDFGKIGTGAFWISVITIALVTTIESLLSALAVDSLDIFKRKSNLNRDVSAMGFGAVASAAIGGLPMISEIVRSSANVTNGAKTQWANFIHGLFLLAFMLILAPMINHIPLSALAAMLIFTGYRLASPKEFKHTWKIGKSELLVFVVTLVMVLVTDLLIGIAMGIVLNMVINVIKGTSLGNLFKVKVKEEVVGNGVILHIKGAVIFSNYLALKKYLLKHADKQDIQLDLSEVNLLDHTVVHHLSGFEEDRQREGKQFSLINDLHLNPVSEHPLAERSAKAKPLELSLSKRDILLHDFAKAEGWEYNPGSNQAQKWAGFSMLHGIAISKENNIISGGILIAETNQTHPFLFADLVGTKGAELSVQNLSFSALTFDLQGVPDFTLVKESRVDRLLEKAGVQDIDFEENHAFSSAFVLKGKDERGIRAFFDTDMLAFFALNKDYQVEVAAGKVFVSAYGKVLQPAEINKMIHFSKGIISRKNKQAEKNQNSKQQGMAGSLPFPKAMERS